METGIVAPSGRALRAHAFGRSLRAVTVGGAERGRTMRACVLHGARALEVREVPEPEPGAHEVLVRVEAVGLCGTDFHIFAGEANYNTDERGQAIPLEQQAQIL